jgi:hypothetical protein
MKLLPFIILMSFLACASNNKDKKDSKKKIYPDECSQFFPFQGKIVDLESYEYVDIAKSNSTLYTDCSVYAHKFKLESYDTVQISGKKMTIFNDDDEGKYQLVIKGEDGSKRIDLPVDLPLEEVREYYIHLIGFGDAVIVLMLDFYGKDFIVCKYDSNGELLLTTRLEHSFITHPDPNTDYYHPYLYYFGETNSQIIFSAGCFSEKLKTIILSVEDFALLEFDKSVSGLILDEKESEVIGFASYIDDDFEVLLFDGREFKFEIEYASNACDFILKGEKLYIANYHPIATGSSLHCYDLTKKKVIWTADVKQINASHSEYYNSVVLGLYKDKVLMYGLEANGEYLQVFDADSGERLAVFGDFFEYE